MERFWKNPRKYIPLLQSAYAIATLDFTIHPQMGYSEYLHRVYQNRWLGCFWQYCGILTLPTIGWTTKQWDDLSFRGVEKGSFVVISTMGNKRDRNFFMRGYNEMIRRIEPHLIIVHGDMLPEMKGRFVNFRYEDTLKKKNELLIPKNLFDISPIFEVKA